MIFFPLFNSGLLFFCCCVTVLFPGSANPVYQAVPENENRKNSPTVLSPAAIFPNVLVHFKIFILVALCFFFFFNVFSCQDLVKSHTHTEYFRLLLGL